MTGNNNPQVFVIGGCPSGSTVLTLLDRQGVHVEHVKRERLPRFHFGEPLIPATYWVRKRLNMQCIIAASGMHECMSRRIAGKSPALVAASQLLRATVPGS